MDIQKINLEKLYNTRDLGGFVTKDGRKIRPHRLIRSGDLYDASEKDIQTLVNVYGLRTVIDFRTAQERAQRPDPEIKGVQNIWHPIFEESHAGITREKEGEKDFLEGFMQDALSGHVSPEDRMNDMYLQMVSSDYVRVQYRTFISLLLDQTQGAVLWHCSAGKDRVGMGTSLILYALGVDMETIFDDYLMVNEFTRDGVAAQLKALAGRGATAAQMDGLKVLLAVKRRYIETVYDYLEKRYGSLDQSLEQAFGMTPEKRKKLQEMYLDSPVQ